jgi:hypothetical protein
MKITFRAFLIVVQLILNTPYSNGQNLVLNPGFEDTTACPYQINQVNFSKHWMSGRGTPDYYNSCANPGNFGIPSNNRGYQAAHGGDAYMGLFTYSFQQPNFREFIMGELNTPLVVGQQYFISFWLNHADLSVLGWASNNICVKFSTTSHNWFSNPDSINNSPQFFVQSIQTDTANWVFVQGSFIADSAYTNFGIGNYFDDASTSLLNITSSSPNYAYYLIDDICISSGENCTNATGIELYDKIKLSIYPNPGSEDLLIKSAYPFKNASIEVINSIGQTIFKKGQINGQEIEIESSAFVNSGIYYLILNYGGKIFFEKIIREQF